MTSVGAAVASRVPTAQDSVQQSPELYRVLLDNDEVRVSSTTQARREGAAARAPGRRRLRLQRQQDPGESADGKVTESAGKTGDVFWRKSVTHALENVGETDVHSLAVEIKRP